MRRAIIISLSIILCAGLAQAKDFIDPLERVLKENKKVFVEDEIIIKLDEENNQKVKGKFKHNPHIVREDFGVFHIDNVGKKLGAQKVERVFKGRLKKFTDKKFSGFYKVKFKKGVNLEDVLQEYRKTAGVDAAQLNYVYDEDVVPNDVYYPEQYAHSLTSAEAAWDVQTGNSSVAVAVIGTGVAWNHPDLAGNIWSNLNEIEGNFIDDDLNGYIDDARGWDFYANDNDPAPTTSSHETEVAGVVGALANNNEGVAGVCWGCQIMPIRAEYTSDSIANAISYATENNAKVVNMSFGNYYLSKYGPDTIVENAVNAAFSNGIVLVATAGNDGMDRKRYPAALDHVMAVSSTTSTDTRSSSSNFGSWINIAAPGSSIFSTTLNDGYKYVNGTSFAAPYISGVAGLLFSKDPNLSPSDVKLRIEYSSDLIETDFFIGTGRVNVFNAVALNSNPDHYAIIKSPSENGLLVGLMEFFGTALGEMYELEYKRKSESVWTAISDGAQTVDGVLGVFDASSLSPGAYDIQLTSYLQTNILQDQVSLYKEGDLMAGSWPVAIGGTVIGAPSYADVDGDGDMEIFASSTNGYVYGMHHDGTLLAGWPCLGGIFMTGSPAIGDIDGDGDVEIIQGAYYGDGGIYAWHHDGTLVANWPLFIGRKYRGAVALADFNNDNALEIVAASVDGQVDVLNGDGTNYSTNWPQIIDANIQTTPAVGDIDGDGDLEIVVHQWTALYAWHHDGSPISEWATWPIEEYSAHTSPVLGDVDGDGVNEIITASASWIRVFKGDGSNVFLKVISASNASYSFLSVGDVDKDGRVEIFTGDDSGGIYGVDDDGSFLPGWPKTADAKISGAIIADANGDGDLDVLAASEDMILYGWNVDGTSLAGTSFPKSLSAGSLVTPALGDFDNDGDVDIVAGNNKGELYAYDLSASFDAQKADWPMYQGNQFNVGAHVFSPNEAPVVGVSATPQSGLAPLEVSFVANASDSDGSIVSYHWDFGDGQTADVPTVAHVYTAAGTYLVVITVMDNRGYTAFDSVTIEVAPSASLAPNAPTNLTASFYKIKRVIQGVQLNWMANLESNLIGYNVYRATTQGGPYMLINSVVANEYKDTTITSGAYYYVVTAVNEDVMESAYSNEATMQSGGGSGGGGGGGKKR